MGKTYRYGFILSKSKGFDPNYGYVRHSFSDENKIQAQHNLREGEVIWYVDAEAFTYQEAEKMADEKAMELFGSNPDWLNELAEKLR